MVIPKGFRPSPVPAWLWDGSGIRLSERASVRDGGKCGTWERSWKPGASQEVNECTSGLL